MPLLAELLATLNEQPWSVALRESVWVYPILESVHVLTIMMFVGFAVMLDLRLLGVFMTSAHVSKVSNALLPRTHAAFALMVASGVVLFYAKPVETSHNVFFQVKLAFIVMAGINILVFHRIVSTNVAVWGADPIPPRAARICGALSILFWFTVVLCGRFIAYNWFK